MKKNEIRKLALLGMAAGVLMANQPEIEAIENDKSINMDYVLAKPSCKAHGGCGGLTASREVNDLHQDHEEAEDEDYLHDDSDAESHKEPV